MNTVVQEIPLLNLSLSFIPALLTLVICTAGRTITGASFTP
jgi:hypothetical protein